MTFLNVLDNIFFGPIKLLLEVVFVIAKRIVNNDSLNVVILSITVNLLLLPFYKRAEVLQKEASETEKKMREGINHIRESFSGDEKMLILQEYYRQNNYNPIIDTFKGSISLLLQIPFFIAAYRFLSSPNVLRGMNASFLPDFTVPDGIIHIYGLHINLLPIMMTAINMLAGTIYNREVPLRSKVQTYGMALVFLVLLYNSPSGLVLYWLCNNLFSLIRISISRFPKSIKFIRICFVIFGVGVAFYAVFLYQALRPKRKVLCLTIGLSLILVSVLPSIIKKYSLSVKVGRDNNSTSGISYCGSIFLTLLIGLLIPSACISASPQEFVDFTLIPNPSVYLVSSLSLAVGLFLVWLQIFYVLMPVSGRKVYDICICILCFIMPINYLFFSISKSIISPRLQYTEGVSFAMKDIFINGAVLIIVAAVVFFVIKKGLSFVKWVIVTGIIVIISMSGINIYKINASVNEAMTNHDVIESDNIPSFHLSKTGKNVVVMMLDRAMGEYIPYLFNEKPILNEQFSGFTWYSNVISYGSHTNLSVPSLCGGYEYTPVELNRRDNERLREKHDEALKVLPAIFTENGFETTLFDPAYAGYQTIPDLTIFSDMPDVRAYLTSGLFIAPEKKEQMIKNNFRNFFCYGMMKVLPLFLQETAYNEGKYNQATGGVQTADGLSKAEGDLTEFENHYLALCNLSNMTDITDDDQDTYLFFCNSTPHNPAYLQTPDYVPTDNVDNEQYDKENKDRFIVDGKKLIVEKPTQMAHYHANMASLLQVGKWLDMLKEQGVYDNTRIIIVSDHGYPLAQKSELLIDDGTGTGETVDVGQFYPLLMVKDFDASHGFTVSDDFMTLADVPFLAVDDLIDNPVNPFTGNALDNSPKFEKNQFIIMPTNFSIYNNNGNTFLPASWAEVHDNIFEPEDWKFYNEDIVLKEYKLP